MPLYQRKTQPPVEALQWDGEEKTLNEAIRLAGDYSHLIVSWKNKKALNIQLLTQGNDYVAHGDWILFTEDGPYVSRKEVFAKWYERVQPMHRV
jgi:hypothetical protein